MDRFLSVKVETRKRFKSTFAPTDDRKRPPASHKGLKVGHTTGGVDALPPMSDEVDEMELMIGINEEDGMHFFGRPQVDHGRPIVIVVVVVVVVVVFVVAVAAAAAFALLYLVIFTYPNVNQSVPTDIRAFI